jgi:Domain of unknown function (DUF4157)
MSIRSFLEEHGGCAGGRLIYYAAQTTVQLANWTRTKHGISAEAKVKLAPLFPELDLDKVQYKMCCSLPGNWFTSADDVEAMTFGYMIYFKDDNIEQSTNGLEVLMHELVHVDQVRRLGSESSFACEYGKGFLAGNYRNNPLEEEAYDFVDAHRL